MLFLILFLFYSAYFMLRYSLDPGRARANISAVYALFGVVLIPVSFLAIRLAENFIHPVVFTRDGPQMSGEHVLHVLRLPRRDARARGRAVPRTSWPASGSTRACASCGRCSRERRARSTSPPRTSSCSSPCSLYVAIISLKLARLERELAELAELRARSGRRAMAELLFWPALLAYGEAAVALVGEARRPGLAGRLAIWGVRVGWLAQTGLLVAAGGAAPTASRGRPGPARSTSSSGSSSART